MLQDLGTSHGNNLSYVKLIYCSVSTAGSQSVQVVTTAVAFRAGKMQLLQRELFQICFVQCSLYSSRITEKLKMLLILGQM